MGSRWGQIEGKVSAMIHIYPNKSGQLKLLLDELKESFDEQNRYFSQVRLILLHPESNLKVILCGKETKLIL